MESDGSLGMGPGIRLPGGRDRPTAFANDTDNLRLSIVHGHIAVPVDSADKGTYYSGVQLYLLWCAVRFSVWCCISFSPVLSFSASFTDFDPPRLAYSCRKVQRMFLVLHTGRTQHPAEKRESWLVYYMKCSVLIVTNGSYTCCAQRARVDWRFDQS